MRYLVSESDVKTLVSEHRPEDLETALVLLYMDKNGIRPTGILEEVAAYANRDTVKVVEDLIQRNKAVLTTEYLIAFFELLIPRNDRNNVGFFVTPRIVANHLAEEAIRQEQQTVCDPACGSGALLVAAAKRLHALHGFPYRRIIEDMLYGVDASPGHIKHAKIVTTLLAAKAGENCAGLRYNLLCADSLALDWAEEFSRVMENGRFGAILCNPPYAAILADGLSGFECVSGRSVPSFLPFVELLFRLRRSDGNASYVVPLSLAYGKSIQFMIIRRMIARTVGMWRFSFFDRSPDSLFGDAVKVRNCIFTLRGDLGGGIVTSGLTRWGSVSRARLLEMVRHQPLIGVNIEKGIPKVSCQIEMESLSVLSARDGLDRLFRQAGSIVDEASIYYFPTAYNWLSVFRHPPSHAETFSLREIACTSVWEADYAYACLSSRTAYWWWLVFGDGFHFNRHMIMSIPLSPEGMAGDTADRIVKEANRLRAKAEAYPIASSNAGTITANYNMLQCADIVSKIDALIAEGVGLPPSFPNHLSRLVWEHVTAGRPGQTKDFYHTKQDNNSC